MVHPEVKFLGRAREREKVIRFQKGRGKITTADSCIPVQLHISCPLRISLEMTWAVVDLWPLTFLLERVFMMSHATSQVCTFSDTTISVNNLRLF